jgi:glyoxalase superfamily protein
MIRWLTVFVDVPADRFDRAARFWAAVTESTVSPPWGERQEFVTLVPGSGTPILAVQQVGDEQSRLHLDIHVDDVAAATERAAELGATVLHADEWTVLTSPAGFVHCLVRGAGGADRPSPVAIGGAGSSLVDQLAIDIPADQFATEVGYWASLIGWPADSVELHPEFTVLRRPDDMPFRLLLQRLGEDDQRPLATAHLDIAAGDDRTTLAAAHERLGARLVRTAPGWVTLTDPAGVTYCLTGRRPSSATG